MSEDGESMLDTYEALLRYRSPRAGHYQQCPYDDCLKGIGSTNQERANTSVPAKMLEHCFPRMGFEYMIHEPEGPIHLYLQRHAALERIWIIHFLRTLEKQQMLSVLQRVAIVLDGPLAIFGAGAWLAHAIQMELARINEAARQAIGNSNFNLLS